MEENKKNESKQEIVFILLVWGMGHLIKIFFSLFFFIACFQTVPFLYKFQV